MRSLSWKVALTSVALVGAGTWSCQKNQSSPDAASPPPGQAPGMQQPGEMQTPGMQQPSGQQSGMQQSPRAQQPGGQASGATQPGSGAESSEQAGSAERWPVAGREAAPMEACPMFVEGTQVEVNNTQDGVALTFTTRSGDVSDLRQRVQRLAQMYLTKTGRSQLRWFPARGQGAGQGTRGSEAGQRGQGQGARSMPGMGHGQGTGGMGRGMSRGMGMGQLPPTTAMVTDVPDGARIELQPTDSAALGELREQARQHAERLDSGECWMTSGQSGSGTNPQGSQPPTQQGAQPPTQQGTQPPTQQGAPGRQGGDSYAR